RFTATRAFMGDSRLFAKTEIIPCRPYGPDPVHPYDMTSSTHPSAAAQMLASFDGAALSLWWGLPFAGLILSIAIVPLIAPSLWHRHYGKIAALFVVALLIPFTVTFGTRETVHNVAHAIVLEYVPFLAMLFALFTIAGGICLRGTLPGTPAVNTALI